MSCQRDGSGVTGISPSIGTAKVTRLPHSGQGLTKRPRPNRLRCLNAQIWHLNTRVYPTREVKCQICAFKQRKRFGRGLLVKPCPECGSRVTFAVPILGDMPVTPEPSL